MTADAESVETAGTKPRLGERIERQSSTIDALLARVAELEAMLAGRNAA